MRENYVLGEQGLKIINFGGSLKRTGNIVALLNAGLVKLMIARISNFFFKTIIVELNIAMKNPFESLPCDEELVEDVWTVCYDHYDKSLYHWVRRVEGDNGYSYTESSKQLIKNAKDYLHPYWIETISQLINTVTRVYSKGFLHGSLKKKKNYVDKEETARNAFKHSSRISDEEILCPWFYGFYKQKPFEGLPYDEELVNDVWTVCYDNYDESLYDCVRRVVGDKGSSYTENSKQLIKNGRYYLRPYWIETISYAKFVSKLLGHPVLKSSKHRLE
ncbi:hypothetical protein ACE6H2_026010 [Prunus campanulata]